MSRVIIIGGGAAGMAAAIGAAENGADVILFEKNEKLGKKVYITGKGRCNLTNACDTWDFFGNVVDNGKFLYSAVYGFSAFDMMNLLESSGCPLKIERGNRVFPASDKSSDVIAALERTIRKLGVKIRLNTTVKDILTSDNIDRGKNNVSVPDDVRTGCIGVRLKSGEKIYADSVIIATGGLAYPATGSTGDGYSFAKTAGHTVTDLYPALVPFECSDEDAKSLQGLSLKNIEASVFDEEKLIYKEFGEMLFTHFGVSGPVILSASSYAAGTICMRPLTLKIDLKPALSTEQLDQRILRDFGEEQNKQFKNSLSKLFPQKLIPVMIARSGIDPEKRVNEVTQAERHRLADITKSFALTLTRLRDFDEAVITQGGVNVKEIDPSTMESKILPGLYFAGEVIDVDALTGGFNLQIAWSTGMLAGRSAAENGNSTD